MLKPGSPSSSGSGVPATVAQEYEFTPTSGQTIMIPESDALLINVMLWNVAPVANLQIILPSLLAGRRVFIFSNNQLTNSTITSAEIGARVANGVVSMNSNDLVVFNSVSVANKIWARVATS